jgi:hypothetical protein
MADFHDLGGRAGVPKLAPGVDVRTMGLDPTQGFILSRVDGRTSLGEICLLVPFPEAQTVDILVKLHRAGVIDIPGVKRPTPGKGLPTGTAPTRAEVASRAPPPAPAPVSVRDLASAPRPDDGVDLSSEMRGRIDELHGKVASANPFALLGVGIDVDKKELRRVYFKMSKDFHPDRYFGRKLGPYQRKLQEVFTALSAAFELLSDDERRAEEALKAKR